MIELVIAACLSTAPECRDFSLIYDAQDVSLMSCALHGQQTIAEWHASHQDWTVSRWACGFREPGSRDI